jgi:hypothetical protein
VMSFLVLVVVWLLPEKIEFPNSSNESDPDDSQPHTLYFILLAIVSIAHDVVNQVMFVCIFAFCSSICDPSIGGTYVTLLAAAHNLGHLWVRFAGKFCTTLR